MADDRFFTKSDPITLSALAGKTGAVLADGADGSMVIKDVAPLQTANKGHVSFLDNMAYLEDFINTKASACFIHEKVVNHTPGETIALVSKSPYKAYALAAQYFYPSKQPPAETHASAVIDAAADVPDSCSIAAGVVIEAGAELSEHCHIEAGALIGCGVKLGNHVRVGANASITHAIIGDHVRLYPGVRVGQDGFGFAIDPAGFVKVPQLGRVIIEDHVEIGANTTIDRGAGPDTVIGQGTWIDNLVQIGHNVKIGKGCVIVAQVGIAGSTAVEDYVMIGGQAGIAGHLTIGTGAKLAAQSGVMRDVPSGEEQMGTPALPIRQFMRHIAILNRLSSGKKTNNKKTNNKDG